MYASLIDDSLLYMSDMYVAPKYRLQGVATKILEHIKKTEDPPALTWRALKTNIEAIKAYKKGGALVEFENERQVGFRVQLKPLPDWLAKPKI